MLHEQGALAVAFARGRRLNAAKRRLVPLPGEPQRIRLNRFDGRCLPFGAQLRELFAALLRNSIKVGAVRVVHLLVEVVVPARRPTAGERVPLAQRNAGARFETRLHHRGQQQAQRD
ncbi:hypothetical protein SDC9_182052 [bioreactor metagenome]|uniref:Uncharacterized protein n=1 Tax=bioreactor metagenome TaxID=1076179 RepID=A0A645H6D8_9ZZZZ